MTKVVLEFFKIGMLLKQISHINLVSIPKGKFQSFARYFRQIAYFIVLYRCISKLIYKRLRLIFADLVNVNQCEPMCLRCIMKTDL